jgi:hypothetical protein
MNHAFMMCILCSPFDESWRYDRGARRHALCTPTRFGMISFTTLIGLGFATSIDVTLPQLTQTIFMVPLRARGTLKALSPQCGQIMCMGFSHRSNTSGALARD